MLGYEGGYRQTNMSCDTFSSNYYPSECASIKYCPSCGYKLTITQSYNCDNRVRCQCCQENWCRLCGQKWRYSQKCCNSLFESNLADIKTDSDDDVDIKDQDKENHEHDENDESDANESPKDNVHFTNNKKNKRKKNNKKAPIQMGDGLVGLSNFGMSCYMNSALQCLLQCPEFVDAFFYDKIKLPTARRSSVDKNSISFIWSKFIKEIYTTNNRSIHPRAIKNALNSLNPTLGRGTQGDAFLVIETLLNGLDEELCSNDELEYRQDIKEASDVPSKEEITKKITELWSLYTDGPNDGSTIIRELFDGAECETLTCPDCKYQLKEFRQFRQIELPLCNKNIKINIKVYIPEIIESEAIKTLNSIIAYDNTSYGLKYMVLSNISQELVQNNINKETVNVKFGYIHPSNNFQHNNANEWIKFMDDTDNCSKIPNYSEIFAIVTSDFDKFEFIPTYNLIANEHEQWVPNIIDTLTFTKIPSNYHQVSGQELIHRMSEIHNQGLEEYKSSPIIYYDNKVVMDDPKHKIQITKKGHLLRIWIHPRFPKRSVSPSNVTVSINVNENKIIQRAVRTASPSSSPSSIAELLSILWDYIEKKLKYFIVNNIVPTCNFNDNEEKQDMEKEKLEAKLLLNKLKKLSESEKLANKWLRMRINGIKKNNEKNGINYTKPKMLDNVSECLKVYEMKETSDGVGVECPECDNVPDIASRQVDILQAPQILLIHIDREQADFSDVDASRKRDNLIKYPIKDLQFASDTYDLFGVVKHYGYGTDHGHYVCYVKSLQNKEWYKMNDSSTSRINCSSSVVTKDASALLYHKTSKN